MDGVFVGGNYVFNCNKVLFYFCLFGRMNQHWPDDGFRLYETNGKPDTGTMKHAAPVILAFWSDKE